MLLSDVRGAGCYTGSRMETRRRSWIRSLSLCGALMLALGIPPGMAGDALSPGPKDYTTTTDFTLDWARRLRGFRSIGDLQQAAGSKGVVSDRHLDGDDPYIAYHWRSEPPETGAIGYMLATLRPDDRINVSIMTTQNEEVILDNRGGFAVEPESPRE